MASPGGAALTDPHPTIVDDWEPRPETWLRRAPSRFAGKPDRPIFIGACPRSGTTLLRGMLNNHPDLAIPPETTFLLSVWWTRARFGDLRVAANRRKLAEWIFDTPGRGGERIRARAFDRDQAIERVVASPPTLGSVFATCFEMFAEAKGKRRWGDKRPRYAWYVDELFQLFPDAQFINVIRDPRGAVASQIPIGWDERDVAVASAANRWELSVRRVDRSAERLRPDQLLDVRYEDLVRDPGATLQRICEFAGLRDGDAIEQMIVRPRRGRFNPGWHERLAEPITAGPIDSWKQQLQSHEVALVEHATERCFDRLGYRPDPGLQAAPKRSDLTKLRRVRVRRAWMWWRYAVGELKRRRITYRHPVAKERADQW